MKYGKHKPQQKAVILMDQVMEVPVERIGAEGDAVTFVQGFAIIIKKQGLQIGDKVKIRINKILNRCAFAEVV